MSVAAGIVGLLVALVLCMDFANAQNAYTRGHLSEPQIKELHNIAIKLQHSIDPQKYACDSYFDYICGRNRPLFSVMGHMPEMTDLIQLFTELQNDNLQFEAKQKLIDFFISCNTFKPVEDCYRETFEYFKPVFGYIITKNKNENTTEVATFLNLMGQFLNNTEHIENFALSPIRAKLFAYREKFKKLSIYFYAGDLNRQYSGLRIYRESYQHNLRNLELHRRLNSTYELGVERTMLDWSLYVYQSRNKPRSYFYPTFTVHMYMTLYNTTERMRDPKRFREIVECLKLPQFVNVLDEARMLAVIYLKSFRSAWMDYSDWIKSSPINEETYYQENEILKRYHLSNKRLYFAFYAQNFCEFGKELAEHVFFLALKYNEDFYTTFSCGQQSESTKKCLDL